MTESRYDTTALHCLIVEGAAGTAESAGFDYFTSATESTDQPEQSAGTL